VGIVENIKREGPQLREIKVVELEIE